MCPSSSPVTLGMVTDLSGQLCGLTEGDLGVSPGTQWYWPSLLRAWALPPCGLGGQLYQTEGLGLGSPGRNVRAGGALSSSRCLHQLGSSSGLARQGGRRQCWLPLDFSALARMPPPSLFLSANLAFPLPRVPSDGGLHGGRAEPCTTG